MARVLPFIDGWVDGITAATPKDTVLTTAVEVWRDTRWDYFIEVNCAGDFNEDFPMVKNDGTPDHVGNGQPSLVYRGSILALPDEKDVPHLVGRTDQWSAVDSLITDLSGITTAEELLTGIDVRVKEAQMQSIGEKIRRALPGRRR